MFDLSFRLAHLLRCIGVAASERVALAAGFAHEEALVGLRSLEAEGLVELGEGPFGGWSLTDEGRAKAQEWIGAELEVTGAVDQVRASYRTFLLLNPLLLQVCTDWQMRRLGSTHILNDHADAEYDAEVLNRLAAIDDEAQEVCADLAGSLSRFGRYPTRLGAALERVFAGDMAALADDLESYHTVWFQLHEDLLATLGISREEERGKG